jgi:energy-coupling factor transporter ATP-binding protein EcfA2
MAQNDKLIEIEDLTKIFYTGEVETHALSGAHLDMKKGEYVAMSGPSGRGKSTPLSIIGLLIAILACTLLSPALGGQEAKPTPHLKDEMRMPWSRSNERFIRRWLVLGDIPLAGTPNGFDKDWLVEHGGETAIQPVEQMAHHLPNGTTIKWRSVKAWGDATDLSDGVGLKRNLVAYAFTTISRKESGKALLCIGSDESIRVWLNGTVVLDTRTQRQLAFDEDQVEVDMKAGDNSLLVKLEQQAGPWVFSARVLERGAIPPRVQEIGPSLMEYSQTNIVVRTDINHDRASQDKVTVQAVGAGGKVYAEKIVTRGDTVRFDAATWPNGAYELRCTTRKLNGLIYATHIPWYKGDAVTAARELVAAGAKANPQTPEGMTTKMLADMVTDRLGKDLSSIIGNPWWAVHSPLMEFEELKLEAAGENDARLRPYGFYRLAYLDDIDGSPQFCRAYLPAGYDRSKKWPLVVRLHGYNGANPEYVKWWSVDQRHSFADNEYAGHEGVIIMEPHGRGNTGYLGFGDQDIMRVINLAKRQFNVDEDRVYLMGESMGGNGTWNVASRHPDLFAAIAPIFGGGDYHTFLSEEQLAGLTPLHRFLADKLTTWPMAEGLLHMPILVYQGDVDQANNVEYSRYGVRMFQRWGYNVRYVEMPGYEHEDLNITGDVIDWFLQHHRIANPTRVRIRSAELQNASDYWARVDQAASPGAFMVVDAEIVAANTIRVDSENVLALTLSPGPGLIDASQPVKVVWNGGAQTVSVQDGHLKLRAPGLEEGALQKNSAVAGPVGDIFNAPFAIVIGTASADPAMNEIIRRKGGALVDFWRQWQRQSPRVFKDSELSDQDAARYSLILIGGADANLVTRRLAAKLPLEIAAGQVKIDGRPFAVNDAYVQMIYPNPLNAQRYVLLVAATSAGGMHFWIPSQLQDNVSPAFDFMIGDGHVSKGGFIFSSDLWVAGGWFDYRWRVRDDLVLSGNADVRSKNSVLHAPQPGLVIDPKILDSYVGSYQQDPSTVAKVKRNDDRLAVQSGEQPPMDLAPVSDVEFLSADDTAQFVFEKDAAGKVASVKVWQNGREFTAKKVE